ncbi:MAG TPA: hypothetical protein PLJ68_10385 [Halanaerobiales bacterium]|nr:hypothetical protein [Halanaerobiales bacterium]
MRRDILLFLIIFISISCMSWAALYTPILMDYPAMIDNFIYYNRYDLINFDLRLPELDERIFTEEAQSKLLNLAYIYEPDRLNNNTYVMENKRYISLEQYWNNRQDNGSVLILEPLPGVAVNAEYDKDELDLSIRENTNISLNLWMNKRTMIWAGYGRENLSWWDFVDLNLIDKGLDNDIEENNDNDYSEENQENRTDIGAELKRTGRMAYFEESNEKGRLGIAYKTNDYFTISADYINDLNSDNSAYSTIIGLEYKDDDIGRVRYHYQLDRGSENARITGLEFAFKDLATFNATYKIYNPETIEEQLNQWIFGLGLNLNDNSTLSFEYLWKQDNVGEDLLEEENKDESNIKARLEIKF